jgi:hypothetical protein
MLKGIVGRKRVSLMTCITGGAAGDILIAGAPDPLVRPAGIVVGLLATPQTKTNENRVIMARENTERFEYTGTRH